jgi:ATP-dependent DNA helicase RecG
VKVSHFGEPGNVDYRNQNLAESMKNLGLVQRFGRGISMAQEAMAQNGNPPIEFDVDDSHVTAILRKRVGKV